MRENCNAGSARSGACLASDGNGTIWVIGGIDKSCVSKYVGETDCWDESTPAMTTVREQASACYLGGTIYVACGVDDDWQQLGTIESLNTEDPQASWQLIKTEGDEPMAC